MVTMKKKKDDYKICVEACKNDPGCHIPKEHEFYQGIAETLEWKRRYFFAKGFETCKKEVNDIIDRISNEMDKK